MALNATIFKAQIQLSDMDRNYYQSFNLTLARHPSETDERMMMRVLAFVLNAEDNLAFTKGLCADDEPDIWLVDDVGDIQHWLEVGLPDERRIRKACNKASKVDIYAYGGRPVELWFQGIKNSLSRFSNLRIWQIPPDISLALAAMAQRSMTLEVMIQDGELWLSNREQDIRFNPAILWEAP